jgi:hypothetical protein
MWQVEVLPQPLREAAVVAPGLYFGARMKMNAADPEIDMAFGREVALAPARVLSRPDLLGNTSANLLIERRGVGTRTCFVIFRLLEETSRFGVNHRLSSVWQCHGRRWGETLSGFADQRSTVAVA